MEIKEIQQMLQALEQCTNASNTLDIFNDFRIACSNINYVQFLTILKNLAFDYASDNNLCVDCCVELVDDTITEPIECQGHTKYREVPIKRCQFCGRVY